MNSHSPTPSSGKGRAGRNPVRRSGALPYMSERQIQAYLLARDAVRRVQRTASLLGAPSQQAGGKLSWTQGDRQQAR